jgi:hypothetical protein
MTREERFAEVRRWTLFVAEPGYEERLFNAADPGCEACGGVGQHRGPGLRWVRCVCTAGKDV